MLQSLMHPFLEDVGIFVGNARQVSDKFLNFLFDQFYDISLVF